MKLLQTQTKTLQEMVDKAIHCVSNNKLIPLTSLISLSVKDKTFTLTTTDATNYFYVSAPGEIETEDFEFSVFADTFVRLIQKMTSENVTLSLDGNILVIEGNGTYKMELPLNEQGKPIKFPNKLTEVGTKVCSAAVQAFKDIVNSHKASVAVDMQNPVLTNYYFGSDCIITSNKKVICYKEGEVIPNYLLNPITLDMITSLGDVDVEVFETESALLFKTDFDTIYSPKVQGIETFPVDKIKTLITQEFDSEFTMSRKAILDVLDRLSLFVTAYDKKAIDLTFNEEGIFFSSAKSNGVELVKFSTCDNFKPFTCTMNIELLQDALNSQTEEFVDVYFGCPVGIKIESGGITQIVAFIDKSKGE